jgi:hypothetical protein
MFDHVQIIKDNDEARFAVIPYEEYIFVRELLSDQDKLIDYLDYLHAQRVKAESTVRLTMAEVRQMLGLADD